MSQRIYYSNEAAMRAQREKAMIALVVTGFGMAMGVALTLLLAPRSGDETRRQLGDTLDQAVVHGREAAEQLMQTVRGR